MDAGFCGTAGPVALLGAALASGRAADEITDDIAIFRTWRVTTNDKKPAVVLGMVDEVGFLDFLDIETGTLSTSPHSEDPGPARTRRCCG